MKAKLVSTKNGTREFHTAMADQEGWRILMKGFIRFLHPLFFMFPQPTLQHTAHTRIVYMSRLSRPIHNKHTSRVGPPSTAPTPLPLTIPEILEHILSFLSDHKRFHVSRPVCKLWYITSRRLGASPSLCLKWSCDLPELELARILKALPSACYLYVWAGGDGSASAWSPLMELLQKQKDGNETIQLNQIEIQGSSFYVSQIVPLLSLLPSVTTLRLVKTGMRTWSMLHELLENCPCLEEFHLCPGEDTPFPRSPALPSSELPTLKRMRTLVLQDLVLISGSLEKLVDACPRLQGLKVVRARTVSTGSKQYDRSIFFQRLATACPQLRRLHFSIKGRRYTERDLWTLFHKEFPAIKEWSFVDSEMVRPQDNGTHSSLALWLERWCGIERTPSRLTDRSEPFLALHEKLQESEQPKLNPLLHRNQVTWLELTGPRTLCLIRDGATALQSYLCQSPHLLHLIVPNMAIFIEDLDVNDMIPEYSQRYLHSKIESARQRRQRVPSHTFSSTYPCVAISAPLASICSNKRIWACRHLQTLHIGVAPLGPGDGGDTGPLILFGYLGRVAPHLRDLFIRRWGINLASKGALCLLTRLRHLEKLVIDCDRLHKFELKDLEWIRRYPRLDLAVLFRNSSPHRQPGCLSKEWPSSFKRIFFPRKPPQKELSRHQQKKQLYQQQQKQQNDGMDVIDMGCVGREIDLRNWKKERDYEIEWGESCWPCLDSFEVRYGEQSAWLNDDKKPAFQSLRSDAHIQFVCRTFEST